MVERRNLPFRIQGSPFESEDEVIIENYQVRETPSGIYEGILRLVSVTYQEQIQQVKRSKYDEKYPHKCYHCGQSVFYLHAYSEFIKKEYLGFDNKEYEKEFKKIWKSKYVNFLCCDCFRIKEYIDIEKI